jgi:hypothetical protein
LVPTPVHATNSSLLAKKSRQGLEIKEICRLSRTPHSADDARAPLRPVRSAPRHGCNAFARTHNLRARSEQRVEVDEVGLRLGDELAISRVIDGLDADDFRAERGHLFFEVPEEPQLGRRRAEQEQLFAAFERVRYAFEKALFVVGMVLIARCSLRVPVLNMLRRDDIFLLDRTRVNAENVSFLVVDPNSYVL